MSNVFGSRLRGIESTSWIDRRSFVIGAGVTGAALGTGLGVVLGQVRNGADRTLRIAPLKLELAPNKIIETFAYNGTVPGPLLRFREGQPVTIDVTNDTDIEDIVHWHGLYLPSLFDGAMEEGSPMIARGGTQRYRFTAKPSGTRWYHSHNIAGTNLTRSLYGGMYGFFIIDPASDPGRYDREVLLATHHWEPRWVSMQDIRKGPPPDKALKCCMDQHPSTTRCLDMASPSAFVRVSAYYFGCSTRARPKT